MTFYPHDGFMNNYLQPDLLIMRLLNLLICPRMPMKVNMSIAVMPMAEELGWSPSVAGLVQVGSTG